jgi:hypothetical protein
MIPGFQVGPYQPLPAYQQVGGTVVQPSGGWEPKRRYFLYAYEAQLLRRRAEEERRLQLLEESKAIDEPISREIAELLRKQEAIDAERADLARLKGLVAQYRSEGIQDLAPRVAAAYARALAQENFSALQALDRELRRQLDEEELALVMILLTEG